MKNLAALPGLLTEREAAAQLGVSLSSLQRLRRSGQIAFVKIGRLVKYTETQLADYVEAATCREKNESVKSEDTGFRNGLIRQIGAEPGSTPIADRHAVKALALQTLRKPSSGSPAGLLNTPTDRANHRFK